MARDCDNNALVALIHSKYDVPDENFTAKINVKYLVLHALRIYGKSPSIEIRKDFTRDEWETWYEFGLVPVVEITKAWRDKPIKWEAILG